MPGLIDLHCHCVPGVDDGARNVDESLDILAALRDLGFERVVTTPHTRPGMFDNTPASLRLAFDDLLRARSSAGSLPTLDLSSEHVCDAIVVRARMEGNGLPYPGGRSVLLEFYTSDFPLTIDHRLADLRRKGYLPVIAHPERYEPLWKHPEILERLLDLGCCALLDSAALIGRYGRRPQQCARQLLERGLYLAACSDAHRVADVQATGSSLRWLRAEYGEEEIEALFISGPQAILLGQSARA